MALSIVGSGFGRTGTMSLKVALDQLGQGPCHHMDEVIAHPEQIPGWRGILKGGAPDWDAVFKGYHSAVDWPAAHYWQEIADAMPDAKIVHTTRPFDSWWESYSSTVGMVIGKAGNGPGHEEIRSVPELVNEVIAKQTFQASFDDKAAAKVAFDAREAEVAAYKDPDRLLVFDVRDGWEPLCKFLGCDVPATAFPHSNSKEEFWKLIKAKLG